MPRKQGLAQGPLLVPCEQSPLSGFAPGQLPALRPVAARNAARPAKIAREGGRRLGAGESQPGPDPLPGPVAVASPLSRRADKGRRYKSVGGATVSA